MASVADSREAFERLVQHYKGKVFRLACSILEDETSAEDATQEVFLKIWRGLPSFRGDAAISTWIYSIARNTCLTRRRRDRDRRTFSLEEGKVEEIASKSRELGLAMHLRALIRQLPDKHRHALLLFYFEDKSYEQVAEAMALPIGTVKTYLHRAKKELATLIEQTAGSAQEGREEEEWPVINSKI